MNRTYRLAALIIWAAIGLGSQAAAELVTFSFSGQMNDADADFQAGDVFHGTYTLDTSTLGAPFSQSIDLTTLYDFAIPHWEIEFPNEHYRFTGSYGSILLGNDTSFGDRYLITMQPGPPGTSITVYHGSNVGVPLPSGRFLDYFQIDLQDRRDFGNDFLTSDALSSDPIPLNLVQFSGGRAMFNNSLFDDQLSWQITQFARVPEPSSMLLGSFGAISLAGLGWRRRGR